MSANTCVYIVFIGCNLPRVLVAWAITDVGSPSPTDVDAETQNSYIWFSAKLRDSNITGYPFSSTRTMWAEPFGKN